MLSALLLIVLCGSVGAIGVAVAAVRIGALLSAGVGADVVQ